MQTNSSLRESSATSQMSQRTNSAAPNRLRTWLLLLLVVGVGLTLSFAILGIQWLQEERARLLFIGLDGMNTYLAIGAAALLVAIVVLVRIKPSPKSLALGGMLMFVICFAASNVLRIDGYYGNRTPRITWSWTPRAELEMKSYLASSQRKRVREVAPDIFVATGNDFPELMGTHRRGRIDGVNLNPNWSKHPPTELWRHPVGLGWSSFAIVGCAAVNLEQRDDLECVVCYDVRTGTEIWCHSEQTRFKHEYGDGPRSTPTIRNGRVFSMGATGILTCVELKSGDLVWKQSVFNDPTTENLLFGMTCSPLVVDGLVIVTPGAGNGAAAIAYKMQTGEEVWRSGDDPASYASPTAATICQETQILSFNGAGLRSYALDGTELWLQPWITQGESRVNVAQPIVLGSSDTIPAKDNDQNPSQWTNVLISSGYDKGTALFKVTRAEQRWSSEIVWESKLLKSKLSNVVIFKDSAFGLDNGILTCIDLKDGSRSWKGGRYGHGKVLLIQDKLLILAESGEIVLVEATPNEHRELSRFQALSSKTWNHFALAGDLVLVRNDREAAAFRLESIPRQ